MVVDNNYDNFFIWHMVAWLQITWKLNIQNLFLQLVFWVKEENKIKIEINNNILSILVESNHFHPPQARLTNLWQEICILLSLIPFEKGGIPSESNYNPVR